MRRKTTEQFVAEAKSVHGDKYDYSETEYINSYTYIAIRCHIHGIFYQTPNNHVIQKHGCPYCGGSVKLTQQQFVERSTKKHNGKYDYSLSEFRGHREKVKIICPKHGVFEQLANSHLLGKGCPLCDNDNRRRPLYGVGINDLPMPSNRELAYKIWRGMLQRCYSEDYQQKEPTYVGCTVCDEWLTLSNFKKFIDNLDNGYQEGYQLDKDILIKGNKIYSPETCCFVPREINSLLLNKKLHRGNMPVGVEQRGKRFGAYCNNNGRRFHLGSFSTPEAAFLAYKKAKEQYVKELAEKYYKEGKITERVYNALLNYRVEITD